MDDEHSEALPTSAQARLGVLFHFDTNFVGDPTPAAARLRELHEAGWIGLLQSDTVETELLGKADPDKRDSLLGQSRPYVVALGPAVLDHSRVGHSVLASPSDVERLRAVYQTLFPGHDQSDVTTGRGKTRLRDAMHVATAIRYGANGLITRDRKDLLNNASAIAEAFNGFGIMDPERTLAFVDRLLARHKQRTGDGPV